MAYEANTWQTGDTITAEKLNNIDAGLKRAASGIQAQYLNTQSVGATTEFLAYLDSTRYSQGSGFTLGTNEITCNFDGVIVVSASIYCNSGFTSGDQVIMTIGKNSDAIVKVSHTMHGTGSQTINSGVVLVSVAAGDVLKLKAQNATGARGTIGSTSPAYANYLSAHYLA